MRRLAALGILLTLTGCGGATHHAAPPSRLPPAPAASWARRADAVAAALATGDGCTARNEALTLREQVVAAINARRVPARFLEPLGSAVNELAARIACKRAPPSPAQPPTTAPAPAGARVEPVAPAATAQQAAGNLAAWLRAYSR